MATPTTHASIGKDATTTTDSHPHRRSMVQNFLLIWLNDDIDQSSEDCRNTLAQLRSVVNNVNIFIQPDECIDFLSEVNDAKAFMIIEGTVGERTVPLIHDMPQLGAIYILCGNISQHERWIKEWAKINGIYTDIKPICEALQMAVKQCHQDAISISFVKMDEGTSGQNLDQLEPSFMYTQIFKEILLEMKHNNKSIKDFVHYCHELYSDSDKELQIIDEFGRDYRPQSSIWWYTRAYFTYNMLNQALRKLEADIIINMGFFIHDLHRQIEQLHREQLDSYHGKTFTVYRGQGLSMTDFEKLQKTIGGLISFNNFLSTSKDRNVSRIFAESASENRSMFGILFKMVIDPSISSTPFAAIDDVSYFKTEEEILFSMHTIFRIGEIKRMDTNDQLYQVELQLTADDDKQLRTLTDRVREEAAGPTGWRRLGALLVKIGQINKAEELYTILLEQTSDEDEKALYYNNLGCVKDNQGDYIEAISFYERALEIFEKTLPPNHLSLATSCNNIGAVYKNMGEYSKSLSFYKKDLEIREKTLPPNHPSFAISYNNIGGLYKNLGEYLKAISAHEKALEICQKTLPQNHPSLSTSYNNIGLVYMNMGDYSKARLFYKKALEIREKTLPSNHPDMAQSYNNMGLVYDNMREYSEALSFFKKAIEIFEQTLPLNHPSLATSYNNIGAVYYNMGEYSDALDFYEKALKIREKTLLPNHPDLATSYNNIGWVYRNMNNYSKALLWFERALDISQRSLPPNHPDTQDLRESIKIVKKKL